MRVLLRLGLLALVGVPAVLVIMWATDRQPANADGDPASGRSVYTGNCSGCHGRNGEGGTGPALVGTDLTLDEAEQVIRVGRPAGAPQGAQRMPGGLVSGSAEEDLLAYLATLLGDSPSPEPPPGPDEPPPPTGDPSGAGWGDNLHGQVGDGSTTDRGEPATFAAAGPWVAVDAGFSHSCAVAADGSMWCWGRNDRGQLGVPPGDDRPRPAQVGSGFDWLGVTAGFKYTCGLKVDGTAWCWGANDFGQLGNGTVSEFAEPSRLPGEDWQSVSAGDGHACGVSGDGRLRCWGNNRQQQLGELSGGPVTESTLPQTVGTGTDWASVEAGFRNTCGIRGGALWCWGSDFRGSLGRPSEGFSTAAPVRIVGSSSDWQQVSVGRDYGCGLRRGALWCWGANDFGKVGNGERFGESLPVRIGTDRSWTVVDTGEYHTCGIRLPGSSWCWGSGGFGRLGQGEDRSDRSRPSRVGSAEDWTDVAVDNGHSLGIRGTSRATTIRFAEGRDGSPIAGGTELPPDYYPGLTVEAAPSGVGYCAGARGVAIQAASSSPDLDLPGGYLTSVVPSGRVGTCSTVPVRIRFDEPVRRVSLTVKAATGVKLRAFDARGDLLSERAVTGGDASVVAVESRTPISYVEWGRSPFVTAVWEMTSSR